MDVGVGAGVGRCTVGCGEGNQSVDLAYNHQWSLRERMGQKSLAASGVAGTGYLPSVEALATLGTL